MSTSRSGNARWMTIAAAAAMTLASLNLASAELPSATAWLDAVDEQAGVEAEASTPATEIGRKLAEFTDRKGDLAPEDAAVAWHDLLQAWIDKGGASTYDPYSGRMSSGLAFSDFVAAMPAPEAWPKLSELLQQADGDDASAAHLFGSFLANDLQGMQTALLDVGKSGRRLENWQRQEFNTLLQETAQIVGDADNAQAIVEAMEQQLDAAEENADSVFQLFVPDLVTLVGEDRASELLERALSSRIRHLEFTPGGQTEALARSVATEQAATMQLPRWSLVNVVGPQAADLYEAMADRFLQKGGARPGVLGRLFGMSAPQEDSFANYEEWQARQYYILSLIATNRSEDAVRVVRRLDENADEISRYGMGLTMPFNAVTKLDKAGLTPQVYEFASRLLTDEPQLPLWDLYVSTAVRTGHTEDMLELFRTAMARQDLSDATRQTIRYAYADALLAAGDVEPALEAMRARLESTLEESEDPSHVAGMAVRIARVADLVEQPELRDEMVAKAVELNSKKADGSIYFSVYGLVASIDTLVEMGADDAAATMLQQALVRQVQQQRDPSRGMRGPVDASDLLAKLAGLYHLQGRHGEVRALVERAPYWGHDDLVDIIGTNAAVQVNLGTAVAAALADAGRDREALDVVHAMLLEDGGQDATYQLLLDLEGQEAMPMLDEIFSRDQFEERPLIWKATLQLGAGDLDAAEETIKRAIRIDPSDGEQGPGDRMRAYAVLADIMEAKGEDATVYRGAVKAIRMAEAADEFFDAGLISHSVDMYEESLTHFSDAYCIQSRLALQLTRLGRTEEAAAHYRKAYELMPSSFGRVESHCFGCEGIFDNAQAESIAEEVFANLMEEQPENPQVHYLYGYLLEQQGDAAAAVPHYQKAVELDADYLNAWKKIAEAAEAGLLSIEERDEATLSLLRLDPLRQHASPHLSQVRDAKAFWTTVAQAREAVEPMPASVLALPATAAAMPAEGASDPYNMFHSVQSFDMYGNPMKQGRIGEPGEELATHLISRLVEQALEAD